MKKVSVTALAAGVVLGASILVACNGQRVDDTDEVNIACYTKEGRFVKWDDDCYDDGLFTAPPGGLRTYSVSKPSSPRPSRQRMG